MQTGVFLDLRLPLVEDNGPVGVAATLALLQGLVAPSGPEFWVPAEYIPIPGPKLEYRAECANIELSPSVANYLKP